MRGIVQGILKGEASLYHWPPVWLVWNQLYDNWQFLFLFAKQTNSKPVKQEVNGTVILPPLVFPGLSFEKELSRQDKMQLGHNWEWQEWDFLENLIKFCSLRITENMLNWSIMRMNETYHSFSVGYCKINFQLNSAWIKLARFNNVNMYGTMFDWHILSV